MLLKKKSICKDRKDIIIIFDLRRKGKSAITCMTKTKRKKVILFAER
jgi:hypothetical protein